MALSTSGPTSATSPTTAWLSASALLEDTGVATAPGIDFDPVDGHRFLRLSFAVATVELRDAIARMIAWFASQPLRAIPA